MTVDDDNEELQKYFNKTQILYAKIKETSTTCFQSVSFFLLNRQTLEDIKNK